MRIKVTFINISLPCTFQIFLLLTTKNEPKKKNETNTTHHYSMPLLIHLLQKKSLIYFSKISILYINKNKNLHMSAFFCTFAAAKSYWLGRHIIKKRLLALVLAYRNPENFTNPKQEGSKRPLGYVYPAAEHPLVDCSVWWHFIFGVGVTCLFLLQGFPVPLTGE